jgi:hypothetical protein
MLRQKHRKSKRITVSILAAASLVSSANAAFPGDKAAPAPTECASTSPPSNGTTVNAPSASGAPNAALALELRQLKESVQAQAQILAAHTQELEAERASLHEELDRIAKLETDLQVTSVDPALALPSSPASPLAADNTAQRPEDLSTRVQNLENAVKKFGPFIFSGDFRLRDEPFFGGPADQSLDRNRMRYRLRFNVDTKLNDDISGGFAFATGDVNDPISTNQTATQFYTRKPFSLDRAFITYTPSAFKPLTLTGGKFAYPWYNTELTWDKDLNPEGVAQTLAFNLESTPVLKRIAFVGFELPFAEVAGVSLNDKSIVQSVAYGGQIQTSWQLAHWLKFSAYSGFYNFHNADPIALALAKASAKNPQTPLVGLLPLGSGSNAVQNSVTTTTATSIVTLNGVTAPTGVTTVTNAQFASKFGLLDSIARFDVATPSERWPVTLIGDYVQNTEACANLNNILGSPANTATATYSQSTNASCNPHQRRGYWAESQVGRAQKRGDWQFGYTRIFVEREAVLSNFNYSEMRQGSNVTEHRVSVLYQAHRNVQLDFIGLFGRPLNFSSSKPPEDLLKRLQFDVVYTF